MNTHFFKAPCSSNPCQNGGVCFNSNNNISPYYGCSCSSGYTGFNCQTGNKIFIGHLSVIIPFRIVVHYIHPLIEKGEWVSRT